MYWGYGKENVTNEKKKNIINNTHTHEPGYASLLFIRVMTASNTDGSNTSFLIFRVWREKKKREEGMGARMPFPPSNVVYMCQISLFSHLPGVKEMTKEGNCEVTYSWEIISNE